MQFFFSEFKADYEHYDFPYQVFAKLEFGDDLTRIYASGLLPTRHKKGIFYLARSTRVKLSNFSLTSENRRIMGKVSDLNLEIKPVENFEYNLEVQRFCALSTRALGKGKAVFSTDQIKKMFAGETNVTHIATYRKSDGQVAGYACIVVTGSLCHYAYPFGEANSDNQNLNIGMMTMAVNWAYNQHKQYIYLGTSYTQGSLYKAQFNNFEFFTGWKWSMNLDQLKGLIERDNHHLISDKEFVAEKFESENVFEEISTVRVRYK